MALQKLPGIYEKGVKKKKKKKTKKKKDYDVEHSLVNMGSEYSLSNLS